jgi:8-oxo-dGTP diphosphatase
VKDPFDLVRELFHAINRRDVDAISAIYDPACVIEHVFVDDPGIYDGRDVARTKWMAEFEQYAGALPGGLAFDVRRVAGLQTGWGWIRADWTRAVRDVATGQERRDDGYSHFLIENGCIRRHRSVVHDQPASREAAHRDDKKRPIVGVGAVIVADDGRVVLVKRHHEPLAGQWSLPGGGLEIGETLEAGVAREVLEETGLVVDVGPVIEVFDRILMDERGDVGYHFVLVDYLCRPRGGALAAGSDVDDVALVEPSALAPYRITEKAQSVIARALEMKASFS